MWKSGVAQQHYFRDLPARLAVAFLSSGAIDPIYRPLANQRHSLFLAHQPFHLTFESCFATFWIGGGLSYLVDRVFWAGDPH